MNYASLLFKTVKGEPYVSIWSFSNAFAVLSAVAGERKTIRTNLLKLSVITRMFLFFLVVSTGFPSKHIEKCSSGTEAGNRFMNVLRFLALTRPRAQLVHFRAVATSTATDGQ